MIGQRQGESVATLGRASISVGGLPDMPQIALPVVVAAGGDPDLVAGDLVDEAVLVGDSSGPVAGEVVLERLRFTDAFVAVALDVSKERIDAGLNTIAGNLGRQLKSGKITEADRNAALKRITPVANFEGFAEYDLVIESAIEDEQVKRKIFQALCPHLQPHTLVASNTSSISITRLAAVTGRPEKFMGIHFMNPVPVMELVELIRGIATEEATFAAVKEFTLALHKTIAVAEDFPAFIVNRILLPMINEAIYTLYEGVGGVEAIDTAMKLGAGHPMGPCELADFGGFDVIQMAQDAVFEYTHSESAKLNILYRKMLEAGRLGRKNGKGFYDYAERT